MNYKKIKFVILTVLSFSPLLIHSQPPQTDLHKLSFLSGNWTTSTDWGNMSENWSKPLGNSMMCAYHCVKDGKIVFYEFIVIEQNESKVVMKLRHFDPGSIGQEEKDKPYDFPLVSLENNSAKFESLDKKTVITYQRVSENKLLCVLYQQKKDSKWEEYKFDYVLAK